MQLPHHCPGPNNILRISFVPEPSDHLISVANIKRKITKTNSFSARVVLLLEMCDFVGDWLLSGIKEDKITILILISQPESSIDKAQNVRARSDSLA